MSAGIGTGVSTSSKHKESPVITSKTIVKQIANKDIAKRRAVESLDHTPGRKVGERMHLEVTPDRIRVRAYEIFLARNGGPGDAKSDWCQAERELNGKADATPACDDSNADPAVLEVKTRADARRQPAASDRGGL